eukprot:5418612-Prymnesium_polylepis.1
MYALAVGERYSASKSTSRSTRPCLAASHASSIAPLAPWSEPKGIILPTPSRSQISSVSEAKVL